MIGVVKGFHSAAMDPLQGFPPIKPKYVRLKNILILLDDNNHSCSVILVLVGVVMVTVKA